MEETIGSRWLYFFRIRGINVPLLFALRGFRWEMDVVYDPWLWWLIMRVFFGKVMVAILLSVRRGELRVLFV